MPSPFPGMDPYLEASGLWPDFHMGFLAEWREQLYNRLPDRYQVIFEETVHLVEVQPDKETTRTIRPDLAIVDRGRRSQTPTAGTTATLEPTTIPYVTVTEEIRESWIEIHHLPDQTLVAVLELLSPSNKNDLGYREYLARRESIMRQQVHLVELDVLLAGRRMRLRKPLPKADYYAMVAHSDRRPNVDVYPWSIRRTLPTIPIPLKAPDPDASTDLAEVFAIAYEKGRYQRSIDYSKPLNLPLAEEDLAWAHEQARKAK